MKAGEPADRFRFCISSTIISAFVVYETELFHCQVEKAHPDVMMIMLQLFDEGRITDSTGKAYAWV